VTEIWQTNQYIIAKLTMFLLLDIVFKLRYADVLVEKISILPHRRDWNFLWGGVSFKTKKIKEMYEASFKCFQRGGGEGGGLVFPYRGMETFCNFIMQAQKQCFSKNTYSL